MSAIETDGGSVAAMLIGEAALLADARDAAAAIGARVVFELGWNDVAAGVAVPATRTVIVAEARGIDDERLSTALPLLAATADAVDAPIVVSLSAGSIDVVAASLMGARCQMLCDPGPADRTIALAVAAQVIGEPMLHDPRIHEGEAARLKRLNEEVARIADVLSRLTRKDSADRSSASEVSDRHMVFATQRQDDIVIEPSEIRRAIRGRRLRDQHFGPGLFEEPAWDMILDLFAAELERSRVSVSSLCIAAAVAPTTALRWISKLVEAGLFERQPDPFDRRRAYMELSERASAAMRDYVAAMRRAGLSLA